MREHNEAVLCLNWMACGRWTSSPSPPDAMQAEVTARIRRLVHEQPPPVDAPSEEAALKELLRGRSIYEPTAAASLAPYQPGMVSLPNDLSSAPDLLALCPDHARFSWRATVSAC